QRGEEEHEDRRLARERVLTDVGARLTGRVLARQLDRFGPRVEAYPAVEGLAHRSGDEEGPHGQREKPHRPHPLPEELGERAGHDGARHPGPAEDAEDPPALPWIEELRDSAPEADRDQRGEGLAVDV